MSGISWEAIVSIIESRRAARSPVIDMMLTVRERYGVDYVLPDPSGMTDEPTKVLTPALVAQAIDQPALRAASVMPNIYVPALKPHIELSVTKAMNRRGAMNAIWRDSRLPLGLRRAFRHLRAYNTCVFTVEPDFKCGLPKVMIRDPLTAFPEDRPPEDLSLPHDIGFIHGKSATWLRQYFPQCRAEDGGPVPAPEKSAIDETWDMLEWMDEDNIVIGLLGPRIISQARFDRGSAGQVPRDMELYRFENRSGCCAAVCPTTVTLDLVASQAAKIIGHVDLQGQILGLEIAAIQKSIWPDRFIIGKDSNPPQLVSGKWQEGSSGGVNIIENATQIGELRGEPSPSAGRMREELERNARVSSGLIPAMGGEVSGSSRTGRGLDALVGVAVDPGIQEIQEIVGYALESVNEAIGHCFTGYWPSKKYTMISGLGGAGRYAEWQPNRDIKESVGNSVSYAVVGAARQGTTVILGQMVGAKLMSHKTARMKHPDVDDPEMEDREILEEDMDEALKVTILQAANTQGPEGMLMTDAAKIRARIRKGDTLDQAVLTVNEERQASQAALAQDPQLAAGPEGMPGVAGPESGVMPPPGVGPGAPPTHSPEAPGMGVEGPSADQNRLRLLAGAMRQTSSLGVR